MDYHYQQLITEHYQSPRHQGLLTNATHQFKQTNPLCGDELTISLRVEDGIVQAVGWQGSGCIISQAAASWFSEQLLNKPLADIQSLQAEDYLKDFADGISPGRLACALLPLTTIKNK